MILAFDIGGTTVKYGWWSEAQLQDKGHFATPDTWLEMKKELLQVFQEKDPIEGVTFSMPGAVDTKQGIIKGISAVPYLHHFPIKEELEGLFQLPVALENDANSAALAELKFGVAQEKESVAFFIIGSGIGGSLSFNGKLMKGQHLFAGEFGYLLLDDGKTLSESASPVQIARKYGISHGLSDSFNGKELFELKEQGDKDAIIAVEGMYRALAKAMYSVCLTYDPELIVIGGGISSRTEILQPIKEYLAALLLNHGAEEITVDVQFCHFRQDANLVGAVANYLQGEEDVR